MSTNARSDVLFDALGDPTRRQIFERLRHGPTPVGVLASGLPVSRPAVSQHLRVLKQARLVMDEPVGNRRLYRIDPTGLEALRTFLESYWSDRLAAFKEVADRAGRDAVRPVRGSARKSRKEQQR